MVKMVISTYLLITGMTNIWIIIREYPDKFESIIKKVVHHTVGGDINNLIVDNIMITHTLYGTLAITYVHHRLETANEARMRLLHCAGQKRLKKEKTESATKKKIEADKEYKEYMRLKRKFDDDFKPNYTAPVTQLEEVTS